MEVLITVFKHKKIVAERRGENPFHVSVTGGQGRAADRRCS